MSHLKIAKPSSPAQRVTQTTLDCWRVTPADVRSWKLPRFQRPLRVNARVEQLAGQIALDGGVIPGVICIGLLGGERYLVAGQHRREAFLMAAESVQDSGGDPLVGYVDVRVIHFGSMAEMSDEFSALNSRLVPMRADDTLRALEESCRPVAELRDACPFVGYDNIRRGDRSPVVSMATVLRTWNGSAHEVPHSSGVTASQLATELTSEDAGLAVRFLTCAFTAWGRDASGHKLWGSLNLLICAWLYRRIVLSAYSSRTTLVEDEQFTRCLMHLSASQVYCDWLVGRNLNTRDLGPAYMRVKGLLAARLEQDTGRRHLLPQPSWASK